MPAAIYHPRFAVRLFVPNLGSPAERTAQEEIEDVYQLDVLAHKVTIRSNSMNHADECDLSLNYDDCGIDPRFLKSAEVYVHLADTDGGTFVPSAENLRFIGIVTDVARTFEEGGGKNIQIKALDYTTLFLVCHQFPPIGVPDFTQTLRDAWARVCDYTGYVDLDGTVVSTVQRLKHNIEFVPPELGDRKIGQAVGERLTKFGKLQPPPSCDAWAVWQTAVGSMGLVSFFRNDRCIVTTASDYFTSDDPPCFIYGENILKLSEKRDTHSVSAKNVCIMCMNPLTMQTLEAFWPPKRFVQESTGGGGTKGHRVKKGKKIAASALGAAIVVKASDYETFPCPMPITDPEILERFAERVWEERARQELRGNLSTREMSLGTLDGKAFNLLMLQAGDRVRVEIDRGALTLIQKAPESQRAALLMERGYSRSMAGYISKNLASITAVSPEFQVHSVSVTVDTTSPPGSYDMEMEFVNRIDVNGAAEAGEGKATAPVTGQAPTAKARAASKASRSGKDPKPLVIRGGR